MHTLYANIIYGYPAELVAKWCPLEACSEGLQPRKGHNSLIWCQTYIPVRGAQVFMVIKTCIKSENDVLKPSKKITYPSNFVRADTNTRINAHKIEAFQSKVAITYGSIHILTTPVEYSYPVISMNSYNQTYQTDFGRLYIWWYQD